MRPTTKLSEVAPINCDPAQSVEGENTILTLLNRIRDWRDHPAWIAFFQRHQPMLRGWCRRFDLDSDESDELCQRVWVELMSRLRTFQYDPSLRFHGWLWRLFRSRAIDWLRQRRRMQLLSLDDGPFEGSPLIREDPDSTVDERELEQGSVSLILLHHAKEATDAVRSRVDPETWRAYWIVAIEDQPVREVADALGKSYTAVYNGCKRVDRMLRQEGQRRLAAIRSEAPTSFATDRS